MTNRKPERHLEGTDKGTLRTSRLRLARLPIHFFTAAVTFFGLGVVTAPWVVSDLVDFFYHPWLLAVKLLLAGGPAAVALLRRVASRRQGRWDLSLVSAMVRLLHEDNHFFTHLLSHLHFNLEARLVYVS